MQPKAHETSLAIPRPSALRRCLLICAATVSAAQAANTPLSPITDLGAFAYGHSINSLGQICGDSTGDYLYPSVWNDGSVTPLGTRGHAYAINDAGLIVGQSDRDAVSWNSGGVANVLPLQSGARSAEATAVNNQGLIAGSFLNAANYTHACHWQNGLFHDLGTPFGNQSTVRGINNQGDIVVDSWVYSGVFHTYLYRNGQFSQLLTDVASLGSSYARHINDSGMVVGALTLSDGTQTGYLWQNGVTTLLPTPSGKDRPSPQAVNNLGLIVGGGWNSTFPAGNSGARACIWEGQQVAFLDDLIATNSGWTLKSATDINDLGQIVGSGEVNGVTHGFLLTPVVPEPSSVAMLILGLACLWPSLHRRSAQHGVPLASGRVV